MKRPRGKRDEESLESILLHSQTHRKSKSPTPSYYLSPVSTTKISTLKPPSYTRNSPQPSHRKVKKRNSKVRDENIHYGEPPMHRRSETTNPDYSRNIVRNREPKRHRVSSWDSSDNADDHQIRREKQFRRMKRNGMRSHPRDFVVPIENPRRRKKSKKVKNPVPSNGSRRKASLTTSEMSISTVMSKAERDEALKRPDNITFTERKTNMSRTYVRHQRGSLVFEKEVMNLANVVPEVLKKNQNDENEDPNMWWMFQEENWAREMHNTTQSQEFRYIIAMILLSISGTVLAFMVSKVVSWMWSFQDDLYFREDLDKTAKLLIIMGIKIACALLATALTLCFAPNCAGSGVPHLRAIVNGVWIPQYLSKTSLVVKIAGVMCILSSGLPVGLEGPFIHSLAIIGRQLTKLEYFRALDSQRLLLAACASAVAAVYGATFGAVLFAVEVTRSYYDIQAYWCAFCAAITGNVMRELMSDLRPDNLRFFHRTLHTEHLKKVEYLFVFLIAVVCGLVGVLYIRCMKWWRMFQDSTRNYISPYLLVIVNTGLFSVITFIIGEYCFRPSRIVVLDLFGVTPLHECSNPGSTCNIKNWKSNGLFAGEEADLIPLNLFVFICINFLFSLSSLTMPYPSGVFGPTFAMGAAVGRVFGELYTAIDSTNSFVSGSTAAYSIIGAAAMTGSITQTFSVALITVEISHEISISIPIMFAVMISCFLSASLGPSLFDSILDAKGIPVLPLTPSNSISVSQQSARPVIASDVMVPIKDEKFPDGIPVLTRSMAFADVIQALNQNSDVFFPIINSKESRQLLGEVSRRTLREKLIELSMQGGSMFSGDRQRKDSILQDIEEPPKKLMSPRKSQTENDELIRKAATVQKAYITSQLNDQSDHIEKYKTQYTQRRRSIIKTLKSMATEIESVVDSAPDADDGFQTWSDMITYTDDSTSIQSEDNLDLIFELACDYNMTPVSVPPAMPLTKIYKLFHILRPSKIYVQQQTRLVGAIVEEKLIERERQYAKYHRELL